MGKRIQVAGGRYLGDTAPTTRCEPHSSGDATLTPEAIRTLLRECCTVVKPGETLIIRVPWGTPARTVHELGRTVHQQAQVAGAQFHTLVVPAAEIGTGEAPREAAGEVTHACPPDGSDGLMPCCGQTPFEVPRTERITLDPELVTCGGHL